VADRQRVVAMRRQDEFLQPLTSPKAVVIDGSLACILRELPAPTARRHGRSVACGHARR
jgi:hypothetical protein